MADQKITQLNALLAADAQATVDVLPVADVSTAETKKITLADAVTSGIGSIANNTIPGAKLQNGSVTATQIGTGVVGTTQLADSGVTTAKINDGAVTTAKIATDAVTATEIAANAVGSSELADNAVDTAAIQNNAVTTAKVADGAITAAKIAPGVLGDTQIADGSITSAKLADSAVTTAKIADDAVTAAKLATGAVDNTALGASAVTAAKIADGTITAAKLANDLDGSEFLTQAPNAVLVGPTSGANAVPTFRELVAADLPTITGDLLPAATASVLGAVSPGAGLAVDNSGILSIDNTLTAGTATKVTYNTSGIITAGTTLSAADIPVLDTSKITTGTFGSNLIGNGAITGAKLASEATVLFGGAGSTAGVVTFPTAQFKGQYFYDELNQDLYIWSGSAWLPITIISGELIYAGTYDASVNQVSSITSAGGAVGLTVGAALPAASSSNSRYYLVVSDSGTGSGNAPAEPLAPPDMILSNGTSWDLIDVSNAIAGQTATNISFTPYGGIVATNVQTALQELDDDKLPKAGGTVTGQLLIGTAGSLVFEGSTADDYETTIAVVDPTADRTITLPNVSGTVVTTGDTGTVTSTMIADGTITNADINASAAIAYSKLASLTSGHIIVGNVSDVATATEVTGDITISNTGVTSISSGVIVNADIASGAAIAGSKISPDFGSQTVTTTGVFSAALGSASTPSITITGDTNTGIYSPGADQLAFATGGTGRLFVNSSGSVGIGTSSVNGLLHLATAETRAILLNNSSIGTAAGDGTYISNKADGSFAIINQENNSFTLGTNNTDRLTITSGGLVGIGSATPGSYNSAADNLVVADSGSGGITIATGTSNYGSIYFADGTSGADQYRGVLEYNHSNNAMAFFTDGSEKFRCDSSGRLLVGTTSGSGRLTVAGNAVGVVSALTDGATITPDFSAANNFSVTLGGNRTLANPSNLTAGQAGTIVITQDGTGSRTLAYGSNWKFPGGTAPTLTTTASAVDVIAYYVESATRITARLISDVK